jgi:hypothetical protein
MTSQPQLRRWFLGCFSLLCASACCAVDVPQSPVTPHVSSDRSASVEERKLDLETAKFEFEKKKYGEEMVKRQRDSHRESIQTWIGGGVVIVPILLAIIGVWVEAYKRRVEESAQRVSREESEKLQFQLKAAEIAFDVRNSREIQPKAAALAQLFPERLPKHFAKNLDPDTIRFGPPATDAKLELLKLLAQYPTQRTVILRTWGHMFPTDIGKWKASEHPNYAWFDGVLSDPNVNADK